MLFGSGRPDIQTILSPPLCTGKEDIEHAVPLLDDAIESTFY